ncbi:MAG: ABC transporter permease subunit [Thermomicrobiales bacterium]
MVIFHALRNALIPVITIIALEIPVVIGGAVITEQIFRIPGIGSLLVQGIGEKMCRW